MGSYPEELKRKAYLEAHKLRRSGLDEETIRARLDKLGIPEGLIRQLYENITKEEAKTAAAEKKEIIYRSYYILIIGGIVSLLSALITRGAFIIIPAGLMAGTIITWFLVGRWHKNK